MTWLDTIHVGDCRQLLGAMARAGVQVQTCVTSPPYFGLRDYGHDGQIGLEPTPEEYVAEMVAVFRGVRELLRDDGTVWLNLGDSYAGSGRGGYPGDASGLEGTHEGQDGSRAAREKIVGHTAREAAVTRKLIKSRRRDDAMIPRSDVRVAGVKPKELMGIPWRVAFALQADGWYLRQDIIWHKPNPMPESVRDRCTKAHEYLFLLSKTRRYHFDAEAISEPVSESTIERLAQPTLAQPTLAQPTLAQQAGSDRVPGKTNGPMKAPPRFGGQKYGDSADPLHANKSGNDYTGSENGRRNKRSVWTVTTKPYKGAHFATFPPDLIEPCILAGAAPGGVVLDPFMGSGTTAEVSQRLGRRFIGCELNPEYAAMFKQHRSQQVGLAV